MQYSLTNEQLVAIKTIIASYSEIQKVVLFGSYATDSYQATADINFAISGDNLSADLSTKLKAQLKQKTNIAVVDVIDYEQITSKKLLQHIDDCGVVVYQQGNSEWVEYKLGDVITLQRGFDLPKKKRKKGKYPVVVSNGIDGTNIDYKVKAPGVITGRSGTLGKVLFVSSNFWPLNTTLWVKNFFDNFPKFIYYFLKTLALENYNSGSGVPTLNRNHICDLEVKIPPLPEQQAIAEVLSSLDDKIDLLHRQNKTLEDMAQTLFRQWFIEEAQDDWEEGQLSDEFDFTMGQSPPSISYNEDKIGLPFYQGNADFDRTFPKERVYTTQPKRIAKKLDTLISVRAPVGEQNLAIKECCIGRGVAAFRYKKNQKFYTYTYFKLKSIIKEIKKFNNEGTVFGSIKKNDFSNLKVILPSSVKILFYEKNVKCFFDKIIKNSIQIQTLENLRDTLLPKLISAEVRVRY
jgi:type I restriction enzyme S subunit